MCAQLQPGRLLLPGHGARPAGYTDFLKLAAGRGYHALDSCGTNLDCYGNVRREIFDFEQPAQYELNSLLGQTNCNGRLVIPSGETIAQNRLAARDTVRNRLLLLLKDLVARGDCGSGWGEFVADSTCLTNGDLSTCTLDWSKIVLAGHSHGAGMVGYIGTIRPASRVLMFAPNPADANATTSPATLATWVTPQGPQFYVDSAAPPYGNARQLFTDIDGMPSGHNAVISNWPARPQNIVDAWGYMLGP